MSRSSIRTQTVIMTGLVIAASTGCYPVVDKLQRRGPAPDTELKTANSESKSGQDETSGEPRAILYEGFDNYSRKVTTSSPQAQQFINQGMQWLYGFNDDEAIRCFREAARLDPECAFAWWGIAYANGININDPVMSERESRDAWEARELCRWSIRRRW